MQEQNTNNEENNEELQEQESKQELGLVIDKPFEVLKPTSYNKEVLKFLTQQFNFRIPDIFHLFGGKYTQDKIAGDLKKWKINLRFIEARSITEYYENKIEFYNKILEPYLDENKNIKIRQLDKVFETFKDVVEKLKNEDYHNIDGEALNESTLTIKEWINLINKDRDFVLKAGALQDSLMKGLADARKLEIEQLNIEEILNLTYDELCKAELELGKSIGDISTPFYIAIKKKMAEINGTGKNIFQDKNLQDWVKTQNESGSTRVQTVKKTKKGKRRKASPKHFAHAEKIRKIMNEHKIPHNFAQQVFKYQKEHPELTIEFVIDKLRSEQNKIKPIEDE